MKLKKIKTGNRTSSGEVELRLAFCSTGPGGGVDPSCGKGSGAAIPSHAGPRATKMALVTKEANAASKNADYAERKSNGAKAVLHDKAAKLHEHAALVHHANASFTQAKIHETLSKQHANKAAKYQAKNDAGKL